MKESQGVQTPKVGMISLGCAKNLVDAEVMLGGAAVAGFEITADADEADVIVVNTCGFIDSAKQESIDAILSAKRRPEQKLVVSGCLSQRYRDELVRELPEVDAFIGLDQIATAGEIFRDVLSKETEAPFALISPKSKYIPDYDTPRFRLTPTHTTYLKIAEGCNHPCSFCVIPQMRGRHRSRTVESVVAEARRLVSEGIREINLISQDTTYYGMDLWQEKAGPRQPVDPLRGPTLIRLLDELGQIEGDFWIRLLYTHPAHWSDDLIQAIARNPKVARYIDMPLQHIHGDMLNLMRRETSREHIENLIDRLRAGIPNLAIRTTFIVGFPGETEAHFASLLEFIEKVRFERLGVFCYSQEEGSRAAKMENQVLTRTKNRRHREAMKLQQRIAAEWAEAQKGRTFRVLADQARLGRTEYDAPDVDCRVVLTKSVPVGSFVDVKVTGSQVYDLVAKPL
ncbi:ribosomal protein S12 methylthiotransferase [Terrimicrobium sacchariphilum]|uniref:Ribosomal protein uS12 methylthiotransferase RimO n=1 Tax=Terrimicrobium sacchariphilum TaxID=690879 RepID=A0A146GFQ3_TERSA|nr:30S ribosomal protein S12 methylthiotransferase RimO [Terrimicrobium sacchariphilum]GAT35278.1 ribosomal protein S12 methylthiotransferase [Terrimicrobium sacchariphilum]